MEVVWVITIQIRTRGEFKLVYFELPLGGVDPIQVAAEIEALGEKLTGSETVLLRGQGPVWVYAMLTHASHATPNVATFEPRKDGYVVATQHNGRFVPGEVIPAASVGLTIEGNQIVETALPKEHLVIAVGGPPHSGKSVFLAELYRQLLARNPGGVFLQRGCPDGEGMWSAESDPALAQAIRQKGAFTPQFCAWVGAAICGLQRGFAITLIDLGGQRISPNDEILAASTHLIVLSSKDDETQAWVEYGQRCGCEVLAVLGSRLVRGSDDALDLSARSTLDCSTAPATGEIVNLDRAAPTTGYADAVAQLASWIHAQA